ncbi:T9SS type A sorting domain-containing protein [Fibrobacter sp. UWB11]|uniref:T9SS type A sorting domain-containing protein n=1 Tax=Fibrobacter sp. UWB11 TaxID=1896202 RepID=UPI00092A45B1|nr:T9SS type A sorting domain-containing protein [Fibrobacter sp. UWB11]SIO31457.1 Por secretion system C-terminal sorting domain-containing protein [Fibrobacter sp. UWB11]
MNKKIIIASALLAASAVFAFDTWLGDAPQVETGIGNESNTYGYWFSYGDDGDGGESKVIWPVELGNEYSATAMDPVVEHCGGICGTAALAKGSLTYNPFVGIGFNVVGEGASGDPVPGDASAWGGLCITYTSAAAPSLELGLGDVDATIGYANPAASLAKAASAAATKSIPWSGFTQPSWYKGTTKMSGTDAAAQLVSVKFKIQAAAGNYDFNICAIGPYTGGICPASCGCCGPVPHAIKPVREASNAKATLLGRNLGISGINSAVTIEVKNIQGQVVAKGSIDKGSTLDLSSLDVGVYMVHVIGKSVNFVDKIVLK